MVNLGSLTRSALVAAVLLAVICSGSAANRLAKCCTTVSKSPIQEPITGYMTQNAHAPCVKAVIMQTESGVYCIHPYAPWVLPKIAAFRKAKREATTQSVVPSTTVSLLSLLTSTASPAPSSAPVPTDTSFPPTSQIPEETFDEGSM